MMVSRWIRENKVKSLLFLIIFYLLFSDQISAFFYNIKYSGRLGSGYDYVSDGAPPAGRGPFSKQRDILTLPNRYGGESVDLLPNNRKVIEESSMSLLVEDVSESIDAIKSKAAELGGFMVNSTLSRPEESAFGTVSVRVPKEKKNQMISFIRGEAKKVISESLVGEDITDQYVDVQARMDTLLKTKTKLEKLLEESDDVDTSLKVQRELINLQDQIDRLRGREKYMEKSSESVKITAHLSTDEFSLPYTPDTNWRPKVIFKQAVRSLVSTLRDIGSFLIWAGVYSVFWIPVVFLVKRVKRKRLGK